LESWSLKPVFLVQVPPMPAQQARSVIEEELGGVPLEEVFEWIDLEQPLGSASIAQVL
jgi:predicted unusual protein kinase regulating ubiquinone biosynthesis (AarF/ABC1/UbiB family)